MSDIIQLPTKTKEKLTALIQQRETINLMINSIVDATRDALEVPDDYKLDDINIGFVKEKDNGFNEQGSH